MARRRPPQPEAYFLRATRLALLELSGFRPEHLQRALQKHLQLLDAQETKFFQHEGRVVETRQVEAWPIQQRAYEDLYDLAGVMAPRANGHARETPFAPVAFHIHLAPGIEVPPDFVAWVQSGLTSEERKALTPAPPVSHAPPRSPRRRPR